MLQLDVASTRSYSPGTVLPLSGSVQCSEPYLEVSAAAENQSIQGHTAAKPSVKEYKTVFPSTCHLLTVWSYKYEHRSSENIKCPIYVVIFFCLLLRRRLCAAKTTA